MNKVEFDSLPDGSKPENSERLLTIAKFNRDRESRAYKSFSGADMADAPLWGFVADALGCIASGKSVEATLDLFAEKWKGYANENHAKVEAAPKIKRGPSSGQSSIGHRYVSDNAWEQQKTFIRSLLV
jgi:predicted RNase H-like HicB family nuclease